MKSSHIQRTTEIVIGQGEMFNYDVSLEDSEGVAINISAATVTNIKLIATEFWDDIEADAVIELTGSLETSGNGFLRFVFVQATTSSLNPQTYLFYVEATIDTLKTTVIKDNLTILRAPNAT